MVNTFVPLEYYYSVFFNSLLFVTIIVYINLFQPNSLDARKQFIKEPLRLFFILVLIIFIGTRPISGLWFGDMRTYAGYFDFYKKNFFIANKDYFFYYCMYLCAKIMDVHTFFLLCAFAYIVPIYIASRRWFGRYAFYGFFIMVTAFSFWPYATNGLRNGLAGSVFLLGISHNKRVAQLLWLAVSVSFHKAMLLPAAAALIGFFYNNPKTLLKLWLLSIPVSLVAGNAFENFFGSIGVLDDSRLSYFTEGNAYDDNFSSTGFRWDFILYSSSAVFAGWYFAIKKGFQDKTYNILFTTYTISNLFWILVIRANFSNRFAYLSWFMIGFVTIYPLLKNPGYFKDANKAIAIILLISYLFTYGLFELPRYI